MKELWYLWVFYIVELLDCQGLWNVLKNILGVSRDP